jgi:hypothetical protein
MPENQNVKEAVKKYSNFRPDLKKLLKESEKKPYLIQ